MFIVVLGLMVRKYNLYILRYLLFIYICVDVVICLVEFKYMYVRFIIIKLCLFLLIKIDFLIFLLCILLYKIKVSDLYEM